MKRQIFYLAFLLTCLGGMAHSGSRWEDTVVVLGSELNTIGDYRGDIALFRSFEAQREDIRARWMQACPSILNADVTLAVMATGIEVLSRDANDFRENYWIVTLSGGGGAANLQRLAQTCSPDAYLRDIVIGEPTRHPVCSQACVSDPALYMEYCAATDFQIILPERGANPFKNCNISDADYQSWLEDSVESGLIVLPD